MTSIELFIKAGYITKYLAALRSPLAHISINVACTINTQVTLQYMKRLINIKYFDICVERYWQDVEQMTLIKKFAQHLINFKW